ncbi:hypothetical protein ACET3Z_016375 [Daucus carota]
MPHLTEEELINEVRHLHSLHRQGPPLQHPTQNPNPPIINPSLIPNRPIFNPNPHSIHPVHNVLNSNWVPQPPIFNSNPSSVHPIHPIANPGNFNNRPGFNPGPGSFYPNSDPSMPILNYDHRPNAHVHNAHFFNHGHGSIVGAMTGYDSNGYGYSGPRVSNVQPYLQSNVESVRHGNLNNKLSRLSLGVQGTKPKNMKKKGKKGGGGGYEEVKKWPAISENEWPCNPVPEPTVGWPELNLKPAAERVLTEEENALLVAGKAQQKALDAATDMFREMMDSDGEIEDSSSDDDDDYEGGGGMDDEKDECKEYKFFSEVFAEDSELRSYYEKNCERGEFSCLVCAGLGQKVGKKYKDCVALVQHSTTIAKTKKRRAHRALGEVICKVLGWDIQKLPSTNLPQT